MAHPPIVHHTGLETSGGATRVARLLMEGHRGLGADVSMTFEHAETDKGQATPPAALGPALPAKSIAHIHCTGDWPALLNAIPEGRRTVLTLHDPELLTGGCPYPLGCTDFDTGCVAPCPRKFSAAPDLKQRKLLAVNRLDPVVVSPSRWLGKMAKAHLDRPVTIIPNGVPWPDQPMRKQDARSKLGIHPAARVVLFVAHGGMDAVYKSGPHWKTMWQDIKNRVPDALCFAVGGDTAGQEKDFIFWPYVDREKLTLLMAAADVLLYPTSADNHSLVILEAMSQGLPIVAFNVGGVPEQIADQQTGLLVGHGKMGLFASTAADLLVDRSRCREFGQAAFALGKKRFSVDRMIADYARLYARII